LRTYMFPSTPQCYDTCGLFHLLSRATEVQVAWPDLNRLELWYLIASSGLVYVLGKLLSTMVKSRGISVGGLKYRIG
jgi:hypothetical protein